MVYQLKLQNVTNYTDGSNESKTYRSYHVTAQDPDTHAVSSLHLDNTLAIAHAAHTNCEDLREVFRGSLYNKAMNDEILHDHIGDQALFIKELQINSVDYNKEEGTFTAEIAANHPQDFLYRPENHDSKLGFSIVGDYLNLSF